MDLDPAEEYKMDSKRRGLALIFNQERFFWRLGLNDRHGTNADRYNLERRWVGANSVILNWGRLLSGRVTIWKNSSSVLLILFYLSVRLQELNFEVKVYDNHKQEEVLDKIGEGAHVRSQICWHGNHPARDVTASFIYNCL